MSRTVVVLLSALVLAAACGRHGLASNTLRDAAVPAEGGPPDGGAPPPIYRESSERFTQIAAGNEEACGITTDGRVRCWGFYGDCRDIDGECPSQKGWLPKSIGQTAKKLSVGRDYACAISLDDSINCWGGQSAFAGVAPDHVDGAFTALSIPYAIQASDGAIVNFDSSWVAPPDASWAPPPIPAGSFTDVSGYLYFCGIRSDGTLACWGSARNDGVTDQPPSGTFIQITTTNFLSCALQADGQVVCWGTEVSSWNRNGSGITPQPDGTFVQLAAYAETVCGVREDGSAACWGWGGLSGFVPPEGTYVQIAVGITSLDAPDYGSPFFCALRPDGIAVCWGGNNSGESSPP
jgi:alpha-tubulin suppressor-like RCC1 family protein